MATILQTDACESHKMGTIVNLTVAQMNKLLGFKAETIPKYQRDKLLRKWDFTLNGTQCSIWEIEKPKRWMFKGREFSFYEETHGILAFHLDLPCLWRRQCSCGRYDDMNPDQIKCDFC
jgi:hypothetical protein